LRGIIAWNYKYPNVGKELELNGGNHDVGIITKVLIDKLGFKKQDITILSEKLRQKDINKLQLRKTLKRHLLSWLLEFVRGNRWLFFWPVTAPNF
jgi:hypothetical protein